MPPRTRISEAPQRISTRDPHQQRRNSSDSDPLHHRPITDRSPRLFIDRRGSQSDPPLLNQRKLGTRISDLESQLGQAQRELKSLKHQLAASVVETDVFEVPMEKKESAGPTPEPDVALRKQLQEVRSELSASRLKEEEMAVKQARLEKELEASEEARAELVERLRAVGDAKEELEAEMKKLSVQTEQWRKAADAAAAVFQLPPIGGGYLAGGDDVDGGGKRKGGSGIRMFGDLWKKK